MLRFRELDLSELDEYVAKVGRVFTPEEFVDKAEYLKLVEKYDYFKSWVLFDERKPAEWVGWCAAGEPVNIAPNAVHFYGGIIFEPYRGQGYSKLLYDYRIQTFPDRDLTVSIKPDRALSMKIALDHGFKPYSESHGYQHLLRKAAPQ